MFTITSTSEASIEGVIVKLRGSVMSEADEHLQNTLAIVIAEHPRNVVLDMSALEVISGVNISELVAFRKQIIAGAPADDTAESRSGGRVVIAGAPPMIEKTLMFTRLDHLFPLYHDVADAITALRGPVTAA